MSLVTTLRLRHESHTKVHAECVSPVQIIGFGSFGRLATPSGQSSLRQTMTNLGMAQSAAFPANFRITPKYSPICSMSMLPPPFAGGAVRAFRICL